MESKPNRISVLRVNVAKIPTRCLLNKIDITATSPAWPKGRRRHAEKTAYVPVILNL
jgi:hypothetical protein